MQYLMYVIIVDRRLDWLLYYCCCSFFPGRKESMNIKRLLRIAINTFLKLSVLWGKTCVPNYPQPIFRWRHTCTCTHRSNWFVRVVSYSEVRRKQYEKRIFKPQFWVCYCRHRHLPKPIFKAAALRRTVMDAERRKEERRKAHSAPGSISTAPLRRRRIIKEVE